MRNSPNFASLDEFAAGLGLAPLDGREANGRIDLVSPPPALTVPNVQQSSMRTANDTFAVEATYGQLAQTPLSDLFFSPTNIDALQEGIRYRIWNETGRGIVIGRQSDTELKIVMRSIFLQLAKHHPQDVVGQVRELNGHVLAWAVPEVLSNLKQHVAYRRDASTLPVPMERAQLMTSKGTRTLEVKSFF